ncbi:MAG: peptidyl-alpha-hydroxyglycine alpha-amidating lyase family protein [Bacteroidota bacterium]
MTEKKYYLLVSAILIIIACNNPEQNSFSKVQHDMTNYQLVKDWPDLPADIKLGNPTGIGIDTNQNIFIFHRADRIWPISGSMPDNYISAKTILVLDRNSGTLLNSWGENLFIMPHGLTVDMNNNVWVTDVGLHQVFKFSHDGKLLMTLGKPKVAGNDSSHFNLPTDVVIAKDGSFYVSDGYGNSRIVKFSSAGQYLFAWGIKGDKESEFDIPHAIDLDNDGNVYVADRENKRVQVFTPEGKFIKEWADKTFGNISSVAVDKENKISVASDYFTTLFGSKVSNSNLILFDSSGHYIAKFAEEEGKKCWYHNVAIDNEGSIYVTDINGNKIQKFRKNSAR